MFAGRAAAIVQANQDKGPKPPQRSDLYNEAVNNFIREQNIKIEKDIQMKNYKPEEGAVYANDQLDPTLVENEKAKEDRFYDHHREILEAKLAMEEEERQNREKEQAMQALANKHPSLLEDQKYRDEFDSINRELTNHHYYKGQYIKDDNNLSELKGQLRALNVRQSTDTHLVFRKLPFVIWFSGLVIVVTAIVLFILINENESFKVQTGEFHQENNKKRSPLWANVLTTLLLLFGLFFGHAGKIEEVVFDKDIGVLSRVKTSIFCRKDLQEWAIDQIANIRVFKRGHDGLQVMTVRYEIQVDFNSAPSQTIWQSQTKDKAIAQMAKIKVFLGIPMHRHDLKFIDESTSQYKSRAMVYEDF